VSLHRLPRMNLALCIGQAMFTRFLAASNIC